MHVKKTENFRRSESKSAFPLFYLSYISKGSRMMYLNGGKQKKRDNKWAGLTIAAILRC